MQDAAARTHDLVTGPSGPVRPSESRTADQDWLRRAVDSQGEAWALVERSGRIDDIAGAIFTVLDSPAAHRRVGARLRDVVWALRSDAVLNWPPDRANTGWRWSARRRDGQAVTLTARPVGSQGWVLRARVGASATGSDEAEGGVPSAGLYHPVTRLPRQPLLLDRLQQAIERGRRTVTHRFALVLVMVEPRDQAGTAGADPGRQRAIAQNLVEAVRPADTIAHLNDEVMAVIVEPLRGDDLSTREAIDTVIDNLRQALDDANRSAAARGSTTGPAPRFSVAVGDGASHPSDLIAAARLQLANAGALDRDLPASVGIARTAAINQRRPSASEGDSGSSTPTAATASRASASQVPVAIEYDLHSRQACGVAMLCAHESGADAVRAALADHQVADGWPGGLVPDLTVAIDRLPSLDMLVSLKRAQQRWLPSGHLTIELAAEAVAGDPEAAIVLINAAVRHDIRVGIHRYGIGPCPDSLIARLPVLRLTLDPDLVSNARTIPQARIKLAATVAWAHARGLKVVAPRLDADAPDPAVTALLTKLGCDIHRGALSPVGSGDQA